MARWRNSAAATPGRLQNLGLCGHAGYGRDAGLFPVSALHQDIEEY